MALRIHTAQSPSFRHSHPVGHAAPAVMEAPVFSLSAADQQRAEELFEAFCNSSSLKTILGLFHQMCECLKLRPNDYRTFYTRLKERMSFSWKWKSFQAKLDKRWSQKEYHKGQICSENKVLVVGAGPCGLRAAVEAALLGAKVVVVEKRDRFSRNNVLHLWPFVITDLRCLGAKKFYPKFCAGSVDHISIRCLQCILLKVSLLLGVEFHYGVAFLDYLEPTAPGDGQLGWRASVLPVGHHVAGYEFDVLIGADGRRNTLPGFQRKVFRAKLAIAITANFKNGNTVEEQNVPEISGVARIYNQQFFKGLHDQFGIDLENIVYYKDATHYFVMTAKKTSLLTKGVLKQDFAEVERLLDRANIDREALKQYAMEAAHFATHNRLPNMDFAINQHGDADVSVFDFTNMYAAENASRIIERHQHRLLINLVGDSLIEPFWPLGTGCAHGFLGVLDCTWMLRQWGLGQRTLLQMLAEREALYRTLSSITQEHLCKDAANYSIDPVSRYVHIDLSKARIVMVRHLLDTDSMEVDKTELSEPTHLRRVPVTGNTPKRFRQRRDTVSEEMLFRWLEDQVGSYGLQMSKLTDFWNSPFPLCALIHHFRPELMSNYYGLGPDEDLNWNLALRICQNELGINTEVKARQLLANDRGRETERENVDPLVLDSILLQLYDIFKRDTPGQYAVQISVDSCASPADLLSPTNRRARFSMQSRKVAAAGQEPSEKRSAVGDPAVSGSKRRQQHTHQASRDASKRHRPAPSSSKDAFLSAKRRESLDAIPINMGEKIQFLESKFNPSPNARLPPKPPVGSYTEGDRHLKDRMVDWEAKTRGSSLREVPEKKMDLAEKNAKSDETLSVDPQVVEQIRQEFRTHGMAGLENKYPPNVIRKVIFQDKKRDMQLRLTGEAKEEKYSSIDESLEKASTWLREGGALERGVRGQNKVSSMAGDYSSTVRPEQVPKVSPTRPAPVAILQPSQNTCYFCQKCVYLAERKSAEGLYFHRTCFRCSHCQNLLNVTGDYTVDRYDPAGAKFYCINHHKYRKPDYSALVSPVKEEPAKVTPERQVFHFDRYPSRENLLSSPTPSVLSPRTLKDVEEDDDYEGALDEEEVLTRNFGSSVVEGEGDGLTSEAESEQGSPLDPEAEVEQWKLKRDKQRADLQRTSSDTSGSDNFGERLPNTYDDSSETEPLENAYASGSDDLDGSVSELDEDDWRENQSTLVVSAQRTSLRARTPSSSSASREASPDLRGHANLVPSQQVDESGVSRLVLPVTYSRQPSERLETPPTYRESTSSTGSVFLTPSTSPSQLQSSSEKKTRDIQWDSNVLETSRRLRMLRMSDPPPEPRTPSQTGNDEVFFTPKTSFGSYRAQIDSSSGSKEDDPVRRRLDFDDEKGKDHLKERLLSSSRDRKAEARARAKLKSDEELGLRTASVSRRKTSGEQDPSIVDIRRGSGSSSDSGPVVGLKPSPSHNFSPSKAGQEERSPGFLASAFQTLAKPWIAAAPDNPERSPKGAISRLAQSVARQSNLIPSASSTSLVFVDSDSDYLERRVSQTAEKHYKQETTRLMQQAQEIQRLIDETQVRVDELGKEGIQIEAKLSGKSLLDEAETEDQLQERWYSSNNDRTKAQLQLDELRLMVKKIQLDDQHRRGQEQLRRLMGIEDAKKTPAEKMQEKSLMDDMVEIRQKKQTLQQQLSAYQSSS